MALGYECQISNRRYGMKFGLDDLDGLFIKIRHLRDGATETEKNLVTYESQYTTGLKLDRAKHLAVKFGFTFRQMIAEWKKYMADDAKGTIWEGGTE